MIEAEVKARVRDPERVKEGLRARAAEHVSVYRDTYYDWPDGSLTAAGRELRPTR
jgi:adenylate cyclase class 2